MVRAGVSWSRSSKHDNMVVMLEMRGAAVYEVFRQVRPLLLGSVKVVESRLRRHGLTVGTRAVLEVLVEHGPAPVPALADRLSLTRQGVQRHVNDLHALGYVRTRPNPTHRRSVLIALTVRGETVFSQIKTDELTQLARMALGWTETDLATAAAVLQALSRDVRGVATDPSNDEGDPL